MCSVSHTSRHRHTYTQIVLLTLFLLNYCFMRTLPYTHTRIHTLTSAPVGNIHYDMSEKEDRLLVATHSATLYSHMYGILIYVHTFFFFCQSVGRSIGLRTKFYISHVRDRICVVCVCECVFVALLYLFNGLFLFLSFFLPSSHINRRVISNFRTACHIHTERESEYSL